MSERFQAYFEKLEGLSIEELDRSVAKLVLVEKEHVALVIAHIAEISRRKGELEQGYRHNILSAERTYGAEFIRGKIEERKRGSAEALLRPSVST